ncbi:restriction endonuclease [Vibrio sp. 10N.286.49.B3]|nr:restriction endonuclease [Vibrio sp. 10N.286.49.B3]
MTSYVEKEWRDAGSKHFQDLALKSMITVQTKPCFTTLSKLISWANQEDEAKFDDSTIDLSVHALDESIKRVTKLIAKYTPPINSSNFTSSAPPIKNIPTTPLPKPFLLLAGISGTGKTRFIRKQVEALGSLSESYCLTSVRPDWHEPSDLLGYVSRLKGQSEYVSTDVIEFIAKAWRSIFHGGFTVSSKVDDCGESKLVVQGNSEALNRAIPYWLCLDEMNLAPVEQYFADYLSIIETREWDWANSDEFTYGCDALLSASVINHQDYTEQLRKQLGFKDEQYDELWQLFCTYGISIPFNLIVAGTVNMDETTHGFSRKVIDRALSFDFGEFFPNDIDEFFEAKSSPKTLSFPIYSQAKLEKFETVTADPDASKTTTFFKVINTVLKGTPFELAFRAFNELCLSVISFAPENEEHLAAVFDDFLMCKVLPRIEGDEDKLTTQEGEPLLETLQKEISQTLSSIWDSERIDLLREGKEAANKIVTVQCRSKIKLTAMQIKLDNGFTSFWP